MDKETEKHNLHMVALLKLLGEYRRSLIECEKQEEPSAQIIEYFNYKTSLLEELIEEIRRQKKSVCVCMYDINGKHYLRDGERILLFAKEKDAIKYMADLNIAIDGSMTIEEYDDKEGE